MDHLFFLMTSNWQLCEKSEAERLAFSSLATTWQSHGEVINDNLMSRLTLCRINDKNYYVKAYKKRGKSFRRYIGRSRIRAEWENIQLLEDLGIPTLRLVAYGEENGLLGAHTGAMVTEEITDVRDLAELVSTGEFSKRTGRWVSEAMNKLAMMVQVMHRHKFIHNDLKWRNILVSLGDKFEVYIIDCPTGRSLGGAFLAPFFERGVIKDLACLDKVGRGALTRTRRLRFYMQYAGQKKLNAEHKMKIRKILAFFRGRE
jgi:tRNA A-37 threonylcarbamoyl transferase component Bud32